jgi:cytoskeletal protein RodZ
MVTNLSDGSDCKAKLVALANSNIQAINAAENYLQSIIKEYAEAGVTIEVDEWLHAADEYGQYSWQMSIQEIELNIQLI